MTRVGPFIIVLGVGLAVSSLALAGLAIGQAQVESLASPLGVRKHGRMMDLPIAHQAMRNELRDVPIGVGARGCHVRSFRINTDLFREGH